jgi:hypothetical protein
MNVLMISPGYPAEMAFFTRGLGQAGVTVIGLGDQHPDALPPLARDALDHYVQVGSLAARSPRPSASWPGACGSTRWNACGSRTWCWPRSCGSSSGCPA